MILFVIIYEWRLKYEQPLLNCDISVIHFLLIEIDNTFLFMDLKLTRNKTNNRIDFKE